MKRILATVVVISLMLVGCQKPSSGERELRQHLTPWFDALNLALSSPRNALPPQIARMQELRREAEVIPVNECMKKAKVLYIEYMDSKIRLFTQFLAGGDVYRHEIDDPKVDFAPFDAAVAECNETK